MYAGGERELCDDREGLATPLGSNRTLFFPPAARAPSLDLQKVDLFEISLLRATYKLLSHDSTGTCVTYDYIISIYAVWAGTLGD
jgi:hypothetical protein